MNLMSRSALSAYSKVQVDTSTEGASPHKLIDLLYEGAIFAVAKAKGHMQNKEIAAKGKAISHAIAIVNEGLNNCLDLEAGGDLALNLRGLYDYMSHKLLLANQHDDIEALDEVSRLLAELRGAWAAIDQAKPAKNMATKAIEPDVQRSSLSYGSA